MKKAYVALVSIVLIGLAGFVVVNEMYSTVSTPSDPKSVELPPVSEKETNAKSESVTPIKEGPTDSEYTDGHLSFQFPSNWTATNQGGYMYFSLNNNNYREYAPPASTGEDIYVTGIIA